MRVIAGSAGGIRLDVPKANIRPTMDRVKAAIFSSLADAIPQSRVLDLFAGTGALGIEALSRGADAVVFVDENRAAIQTIERNLARTSFKGVVRQQEVFAFLRGAKFEQPFRFIFADPPYDKMESGQAYTDLLLTDEKIPQLLDPAGLFVLEKRPQESLIETPLWEVTRAKKYGATEVLFLKRPSVISREVDQPSDMSRLRTT
ncbi:MAG: 16S rRNA (guanine(966)-N(2))-methyltransferase RsmD [Chthoniobacterales bacterium]